MSSNSWIKATDPISISTEGKANGRGQEGVWQAAATGSIAVTQFLISNSKYLLPLVLPRSTWR